MRDKGSIVFPFLDNANPDLSPRADVFENVCERLDGPVFNKKLELLELLNWLAALCFEDRPSLLLIFGKVLHPELSYRELEPLCGVRRTMIYKRVRRLSKLYPQLKYLLGAKKLSSESQRRRRIREGKKVL